MEDSKVTRSNQRGALETCGDWHTLKSLMSLRRAAVDILIYEIFDEKRSSYVKEVLFDPLVSYLVCRTCGYDRYRLRCVLDISMSGANDDG